MSARRLRALSLVAAVAAAAGLAGAQSASANKLVDIEVTSRFVDLAEEPHLPGRPPILHANVLLPDGFDPKNRRGYPVLYLLHGANSDYQSWEKRTDVIEMLAGFPGIVVMPDGGSFGMYTDWWNGAAFGRPQWMSYHLIDLRSAINERYPIRTPRRWHAIAGVSMGGMGAIRYAAADPGYFGSAAAFSGAALDLQAIETLPFVDITGAAAAGGATFEDVWGPPAGPYATANNPQDLIPNLRDTRLYVTSGDGLPCPGDPVPAAIDVVTEVGLRRQADAFVAAAGSTGIDVTAVPTCGAHTNPTAERAMSGALGWRFFAPVSERPSAWTYVTAAPRGEVHGLRFRFAAQPTTVIRFEREEKALRGDGSGTVRIRRGPRCRLDLSLPFEIKLPRACR